MVSMDELLESRKLALEWILNAQVKAPSSVYYGAFYSVFSLKLQCYRIGLASLLEMLGKTLNTLARCYVEDKDERVLEVMKLCADNYLVASQYKGDDPNIFPGVLMEGYGSPKPEQFIAFNSAEAMRALVRLYRITHQLKYLQMARDNAEWLVEVMLNPDGSYLTNYYEGMFNNPKIWNGNFTHQARTAWGLLELWKETELEKYKDSAIKTMDWVVSKQHENGWFERTGEIWNSAEFEMYTSEALYHGGKILGNKSYQEAARRCVEGLAKAQKREPGNFHLLYGQDWNPYFPPDPRDIRQLDRTYVDAEYAALCYNLFLDTGIEKFLEEGDECLQFVYGHQQRDSEDPRIRGGIPYRTAWLEGEPKEVTLRLTVPKHYLDAVDCRLDIMRGVNKYTQLHGML